MLWLGLALVTSAADPIQNLFEQGNRLYEQGQFARALESYEKIERSQGSWKLFYNMGNCHFKLDRFLKAKIYYLKARKIRPLHRSILKNISIVNRRFKDRIPEEKMDFLERSLLRIESWIPLNVISFLLIFFVALFNVSLFTVIRKGRNKWALYGLLFSLILSMLLTGIHVYRVQKRNIRNVAVVIHEQTPLRSGPGSDNTVLFKVNPGLEVKLIDTSGQWFQVSASEDIAGWIRKEELVQI
jgi:hypothetical protein